MEACSNLSQEDAFRLNNLMLEFQAFERLKHADTARAANQGPLTLPNQTGSIFRAIGMSGLLDWKPMDLQQSAEEGQANASTRGPLSSVTPAATRGRPLKRV